MVSQDSDGLDSVEIEALRNYVYRDKDIWRVKLSEDGPAKVTPLKIHLKPNAIPRRAKARKYAPKNVDFMRKHVKVLEEMGNIGRNPHSRRSSPILVVPKPKAVDEFRVSVGTRYPNSEIVPIAVSLPVLDVILANLSEATDYASLDAFKGFWQLPLHPDFQEIYSLLS
jgi:hypothetical protein